MAAAKKTEAELLAEARPGTRRIEGTDIKTYDSFGRVTTPGLDQSLPAAVAHVGEAPYGWGTERRVEGGSPALAEARQAEVEKNRLQAGLSANAADPSLDPSLPTPVESPLAAAESEAGGDAGRRAATGDQSVPDDEKTVEQLMAELSAIRAGRAAGVGGVVAGYTKGGMIPNVNEQQVGSEQKLYHPGKEQAIQEHLQASSAAAVAKGTKEQQLLELAQRGAYTRQSQGVVQAWADNKAAVEEEAALKDANGRIQSAMAEFKAAKPKMITYSDIWGEQDGIGVIRHALGLLAGAFGGARSGRNSYLDQLDTVIQRKLDIQDKNSGILKEAIGHQKSAFDILRNSFRDRTVARKALHAIYLGNAEEAIREQAAAIGIANDDARLLELLVPVTAEKVRLYGEVTGTLRKQSSEQQKYNPPRAIVVGGGGAGKGDKGPDLWRTEAARRTAGTPKMLTASDQIMNGVSRLSPEDEGLVAGLIRSQTAADPTALKNILSQAKDPQAVQEIMFGVNTFVREMAGAATTPSEGTRQAYGALGDGSVGAMKQGAALIRQNAMADERSIAAGDYDAAREAALIRKILERTEEPEQAATGKKPRPKTNVTVLPALPSGK